MTDETDNKQYGRRSSDWYIPVGLVVATVTTLVGVYSLISPIVALIIDINVKLIRLEAMTSRLDKIEKDVNDLERKR